MLKFRDVLIRVGAAVVVAYAERRGRRGPTGA